MALLISVQPLPSRRWAVLNARAAGAWDGLSRYIGAKIII